MTEPTEEPTAGPESGEAEGPAAAPRGESGPPPLSHRMGRFALSAFGALASVGIAVLMLEAAWDGFASERASRHLQWPATLIYIVSQLVLWRLHWGAFQRGVAAVTFLVGLVAGYSVWFGPYDFDSFALLGVPLATLTTGLLGLTVLAGAVAATTAFTNWRYRAGALVVGTMLMGPWISGLMQGLAPGPILKGVGFFPELAWYLQPSLLALGLLGPIALWGLWRVSRGRRLGVRVLAALLALFPLVMTGSAIQLLEAGPGVRREPLRPLTALSRVWQRIDPRQEAPGPPGLSVRSYQGSTRASPHVRDIADTEDELRAGEGEWTELSGWLRVVQPGGYRFETETGQLYVDGLRVDPEGWDEARVLQPGLVSIRLILAAGESARLSWMPPGSDHFEPIPLDVLEQERELPERTPRRAAQLGLEWLQSDALHWQARRNCYGCHVQSQAVTGMSIGWEGGYEVNEQALAALVDFTVRAQQDDGYWWPQEPRVATAWAVASLAQYQERVVERAAPLRPPPGPSGLAVEALDEGLTWLRQNLESHGSGLMLEPDHEEPPVDQGRIAASVNALTGFDALDRHEPALRIRSWLAVEPPVTTQDQVFQLLGLLDQEDHVSQVEGLLAELGRSQNEDGGWGFARGGDSNAFSTGQVLYGLKRAGTSVSSPVFRRGVAWLMESQRADGSWPRPANRGRSSPFASTMWAVIGLAGSYGELVVDFVEPMAGAQLSGPTRLVAHVGNYSGSPVTQVSFWLGDEELGRGQEIEDGRYAIDWSADLEAGPYSLAAVAVTREGRQERAELPIVVPGRLGLDITGPGAGETLQERVPVTVESVGTGSFEQVEIAIEIIDGQLAAEGGELVRDVASQDGGTYRARLPVGRWSQPVRARIHAYGERSDGSVVVDSQEVWLGPRIGLSFVEPAEGALLSQPGEVELAVDLKAPAQLVSLELAAGRDPIELTRDASGRWVGALDPGRLPAGDVQLVALLTADNGELVHATRNIRVGGPRFGIIAPDGQEPVAMPVSIEVEVPPGASGPLGLSVNGRPVTEKPVDPAGGSTVISWDDITAEPGTHRVELVLPHPAGQLTDRIELTLGQGAIEVELDDPEARGGWLPPDTVLVILDSSNSMWAPLVGDEGPRRFRVARDVLSQVVSELPDRSQLGLRAYGHRTESDCSDSELLVPPAAGAGSDVVTTVQGLSPRGRTPLAASLAAAGEDLASASGSAAVVVITDGVESCEGDPVAAAEALRAQGLDLRVHVVGFALSEEGADVSLAEIARAGGGSYFSAADEGELGQALRQAVRLDYQLRDADGVVIAERAVGGGRAELLAGRYSLYLPAAGGLESAPFTLEPGGLLRFVVRPGADGYELVQE